MAAAGITIVKTFTYRDAPEEWSNTYHLDDAPSTPGAWRSTADDLIAAEAAVYSNRVTVVRALCYEDTDDNAVYTYLLADFAGEVDGTLSGSLGTHAPGDSAAWCRWATGLLNSRGKMIYLRKYFHDVQLEASAEIDKVDAAQKTAYETFAAAVLTDSFGGVHVADKNGRRPDGPAAASSYVTTRTLKRRGPRP